MKPLAWNNLLEFKLKKILDKWSVPWTTLESTWPPEKCSLRARSQMEHCCHIWVGAGQSSLSTFYQVQKHLYSLVCDKWSPTLHPLSHRWNDDSLLLLQCCFTWRMFGQTTFPVSTISDLYNLDPPCHLISELSHPNYRNWGIANLSPDWLLPWKLQSSQGWTIIYRCTTRLDVT